VHGDGDTTVGDSNNNNNLPLRHAATHGSPECSGYDVVSQNPYAMFPVYKSARELTANHAAIVSLAIVYIKMIFFSLTKPVTHMLLTVINRLTHR